MLCMQSAFIECSILIILCDHCKQRHRHCLVSGFVPCLSKTDEFYYYSMQENKNFLSNSDSLIYHCDPICFLPNGYVQNIITTCHFYYFFFCQEKCNLVEAKCFVKMNQFQLNICQDEFLFREGLEGELEKERLWKESVRSKLTIA